MSVICRIRGWWWTVKAGAWIYGEWVAGHELHEQSDGGLKCRTCGIVVNHEWED